MINPKYSNVFELLTLSISCAEARRRLHHREQMRAREAREYRLQFGQNTKPALRERVLDSLFALWREAEGH